MESATLNRLRPTSTLQEIISANEQTEILLQSIGIPTESYQDKTLLQICIEKQWNEKELLTWLRKKAVIHEEKIKTKKDNFSQLGQKQLSKTYKRMKDRLHQQLNETDAGFHRICKVHGIQYPVIKEMHWHLQKISEKVRFLLMMTDKSIEPLLSSSSNGSNTILYGESLKFERTVELIVQDQHQIAAHIQKIEDMNSHPDKIEGACGTMKTVFQDMIELFTEVDTFFELLRNGVIPTLNEAMNRN